MDAILAKPTKEGEALPLFNDEETSVLETVAKAAPWLADAAIAARSLSPDAARGILVVSPWGPEDFAVPSPDAGKHRLYSETILKAMEESPDLVKVLWHARALLLVQPGRFAIVLGETPQDARTHVIPELAPLSYLAPFPLEGEMAH